MLAPSPSKRVRFTSKGRGGSEVDISNNNNPMQQYHIPSPPPPTNNGGAASKTSLNRPSDISSSIREDSSGGAGVSSSTSQQPVVSSSSMWSSTSPSGSARHHPQRPPMLNPTDISQRGGVGGGDPTPTTTTDTSARSPSTTTTTNTHPNKRGTNGSQAPTFAPTSEEVPDRVKQARTERLIERQVLAFQREMGRLTNTHTFAAFHNFLSESEDVKYQKEHESKVGARSEGGGGTTKASDLQDDRRVDNFLLGSLAAQSTPRRSSMASVTTPGGGVSNNSKQGNSAGKKSAPQSKHSTSRNVQTIKADLDEKFLPTTPWWMKSNSRIRRPMRGHSSIGASGDASGEGGEGNGGGGGSGLLGGFESCVGMLHHGTQTPKWADSTTTGDPSAVIPVGLKFGLSNWSPLVHRYMLLFDIENNTPTSSISWTA